MLVSEPPNNPKKNREELVAMMIETFNVQNVYIGNQAVLGLYATGLTTGTVLDSGAGITHAVPIFEGFAIPHAIHTIGVSGNDLTEFMQKTLMEHPEYGKMTNTINDSYACRQLCETYKEKGCFVAQDYDAEVKTAQEHNGIMKEFDLPGE